MSVSDEKDRSAEEPDLAALLARLFPKLVALEEPILREAGLSMWEYAIVTKLASTEAIPQVELSRRTNRDPTRLGRHLDDLAARGLIVRARGNDQRQRTVRLTSSGHSVYTKAKRAIRAVEDELLHSTLSTSDAAQLRHLLAQLTAER
ncbi:MarR family winged helix-turn-helix transcriptional regulator [Phytoactinopolyspora limicola]|uniref:MarR family winged helix-turn-helix transcriptional regulator n=1 Tax=Phytoactinopolyspora limicola TaxID=2715536 RepID=UPI001A9C6B1D|nr:MarR family transcriptional regulator [Phytoactinopolyspora limicola]